MGTASDIQMKTKRRLLVEDEQNGPSVTQIRVIIGSRNSFNNKGSGLRLPSPSSQ